jgi:hypothetical protein
MSFLSFASWKKCLRSDLETMMCLRRYLQNQGFSHFPRELVFLMIQYLENRKTIDVSTVSTFGRKKYKRYCVKNDNTLFCIQTTEFDPKGNIVFISTRMKPQRSNQNRFVSLEWNGDDGEDAKCLTAIHEYEGDTELVVEYEYGNVWLTLFYYPSYNEEHKIITNPLTNVWTPQTLDLIQNHEDYKYTELGHHEEGTILYCSDQDTLLDVYIQRFPSFRHELEDKHKTQRILEQYQAVVDRFDLNRDQRFTP